MAPEVILCETLKDDPYDAKADIWSLGVTIIEFAQMEPPNHEMHPMRVLIKIQKSDPPALTYPKRYSRDLNQLLLKCLQKNPDSRASAAELLQVRYVLPLLSPCVCISVNFSYSYSYSIRSLTKWTATAPSWSWWERRKRKWNYKKKRLTRSRSRCDRLPMACLFMLCVTSRGIVVVIVGRSSRGAGFEIARR